MIEAHVVDAWTAPSVRTSAAFRNLTVLGGLAAPLFLWLAGLSLSLSAESTAKRTNNRLVALRAALNRGAWVFALAFLFRLQAFILTPGGSPISLLRVDILNVMGPSLAAGALIWWLSTGGRLAVAALGAAALMTAMVTPLVREATWLNDIPSWLQWYLRPSGEHTTFTLLPWMGFALAGAAAGEMLAVTDRRFERALTMAIGLTGVALLALGLYTATLPPLYRYASFWTSSPTFFAIRTGILMVALWMMFEISRVTRAAAGHASALLERFGRHSLFVYWIHVELVYGYLSWPIRRRLPIWGVGIAYAAFLTLIAVAVELWASRDRSPLAAEFKPLFGGTKNVEIDSAYD